MRALFALALSLVGTVGSAQTIVIDPGHPSEVGVGTKGRRTTELKVAWEVGLALRNRLRREGYAVVMTKQRLNERVTNKRRAEIANAAKATLMVRLHCDASKGSGFSVYYPAKQGTVNGVIGPSPAMLRAVAPMARRFYRAMSQTLAGKLPSEGLRTDAQTYVGRKQGALTGSIYSDVPSILVEMVVLTNPKDEAFILSTAGRAAMVDALAQGVKGAHEAAQLDKLQQSVEGMMPIGSKG